MKEQLKLLFILVFTLCLLLSCDGLFTIAEKSDPGPLEDDEPIIGDPPPPKYPEYVGGIPYKSLPFGDNKADYLSKAPVIPDTTHPVTINGTYYHLPWPCIEKDSGGFVMLTGQIVVLEEALKENGYFPVDVTNVDVMIETDANGYEWAVLTDPPSSVTATLLPVETFTKQLGKDGFLWELKEQAFDDIPEYIFNQCIPGDRIKGEIERIFANKPQNQGIFIRFQSRTKTISGKKYHSVVDIESYSYGFSPPNIP